MLPGMSALDMIGQMLATMNPTQLIEVLAKFKGVSLCSFTPSPIDIVQAFMITHPDQVQDLWVPLSMPVPPGGCAHVLAVIEGVGEYSTVLELLRELQMRYVADPLCTTWLCCAGKLMPTE
jgi:hypothetical protein